MIDKNIINEINEKTDIVSLVSQYVHLEKHGKNYRGICPFHDDTNPSFIVSPEKNICKCFSCGEGGQPITFYQKINNVGFTDALIALAEPLGIELNIEKTESFTKLKEHDALKEASLFYSYSLFNTVSGEAALKYLKSRNLNDETIKHFNIGYAPNNDVINKLLKEKEFSQEVILSSGLVTKLRNSYADVFKDRVMFPITDEFGNTVGFSGRALGDKTPKYYNSHDSAVFNKSEILYHLHEALPDIRRKKTIILHEGFFDCIASFEVGIKNTVATMGTALTHKQAELIAKHAERVIIAFDGDKAGIEATYKAIEVLRNVRVRVDILKLDDNLDPDDYIKKYGKDKYIELFKHNLFDPYSFMYESSKQDLNLKNANDVAILKNIVRDMLSTAPKSVQEHYIKKLSEDLNVSVSSLTGLLGYRKVVQREPEPAKVDKTKKKDQDELPNHFHDAEINLFLIMTTSKEMSSRINHALGPHFICDERVAKLRMLLHMHYYLNNKKYNEDKFVELINKQENSKELLEGLDKIRKSIAYEYKFVFNEKAIEDNITMLKHINIHKQYEAKKKEAEAETESYQKTILLEEQKELKNQLLKVGL